MNPRRKPEDAAIFLCDRHLLRARYGAVRAPRLSDNSPLPQVAIGVARVVPTPELRPKKPKGHLAAALRQISPGVAGSAHIGGAIRIRLEQRGPELLERPGLDLPHPLLGNPKLQSERFQCGAVVLQPALADDLQLTVR